MHQSSFHDEPATLAKMKAFIAENGLQNDLSETRRYHEIYLFDPRKVESAKMKTVLRVPVRRKEGEKNL
ncbi:hypothetical protein [Anaerotignum neopropionicum]|uniref:hypothetical protein n=1 Tax=Anaerotignum neopropionicum TaxID=36847 RepID=UPI002E8DD98E|nr:hypothetical protein [Anaerotignum neopropionicum]